MVFSILAMMKNRKHTGTPWQIMAHYGTLPSNTRDFRLIFSQQDQSSEWFLSSCIVFSSGLQRRRSFDLTHEPWGYFPKSLWSPSESSTHMVQVSKNNLYHCILVLYPLANSQFDPRVPTPIWQDQQVNFFGQRWKWTGKSRKKNAWISMGQQMDD